MNSSIMQSFIFWIDTQHILILLYCKQFVVNTLHLATVAAYFASCKEQISVIYKTNFIKQTYCSLYQLYFNLQFTHAIHELVFGTKISFSRLYCHSHEPQMISSLRAACSWLQLEGVSY